MFPLFIVILLTIRGYLYRNGNNYHILIFSKGCSHEMSILMFISIIIMELVGDCWLNGEISGIYAYIHKPDSSKGYMAKQWRI